MEPQISREPALQLPQPAIETPLWQQSAHGQREGVATHEAGASVGQGAPTALMSVAPSSAQPMQPLQPVALPLAVPPLQQTTTPTTPPLDDDAIDQMWVSKAKKIVEQTHSDPYLESQELGKTKVAYLKTRYNKDIKIAEG